MRLFLFFSCIFSLHCMFSNLGRAETYKDVVPSEFQSIFEGNKSSGRVVVLDVRTASEFKDGHLTEATNVDFFADDFKEKLGQLDRSKLYLVYCRSGNRSGKTLKMMEELKFVEAYNMIGGIVRWRDEGRPVTVDGH